MNKTLKKMSLEYETRIQAKTPWEPTEPMRAALLWLADNVSDEMLEAARNANWHNVERSAISAALRAAAGSALEAKP